VWQSSTPGDGDHTIAAIAEAHRPAVVVTADRELAERVRAVGHDRRADVAPRPPRRLTTDVLPFVRRV
jgi:hypothetical protein